jgi:hypothetical protein
MLYVIHNNQFGNVESRFEKGQYLTIGDFVVILLKEQ